MANQETEKAITVSEFITHLNLYLVSQNALVQGEVGEVKPYPAFLFFKLLDKEKKAVLGCFIWKRDLERLGVELKDGMEVKVLGYPKIKENQGSLNFQVQRISLVGEGQLKEAFERLKNKLAHQGFFDVSRKKPIPPFCNRIGLVTSKFAFGALPDFQKNLKPFGFHVYFCDARVEGINAIDEIVGAVRWLNENMPDLDALVLIRGGGSYESLQAFNSEEVAKSILASKIPVICGVGHEKDETIADLVADLRVSTPSFVAQHLNESWDMALKSVPEVEKNISSSAKKHFANFRQVLIAFENSFSDLMSRQIRYYDKAISDLKQNLTTLFSAHFRAFQSMERDFQTNLVFIQNLIKYGKQKTQELGIAFWQTKTVWQRRIRELVSQQEAALLSASPEFRLKQGYSMTFDAIGKVIKTQSQVKTGQQITTKIYKGQLISEVQ